MDGEGPLEALKGVEGSGIVTDKGDGGISKADSYAGSTVGSVKFRLLLSGDVRRGAYDSVAKEGGEETNLIGRPHECSVHTDNWRGERVAS